MKPPFKVVVDKNGNRGIYNGPALIEFQKEGQTDKQLDDQCAFYNGAWEHGYSCCIKNFEKDLR